MNHESGGKNGFDSVVDGWNSYPGWTANPFPS